MFFAWNVRETAPLVDQKGLTFSVGGEPVMAVGGVVCELVDLTQGVVDRLVATCVLVSELGGVNHYGSVLA